MPQTTLVDLVLFVCQRETMVPARRKGTSLRAETVRSQQKGTGLQRMGVKRSDAEGGTEMDAV